MLLGVLVLAFGLISLAGQGSTSVDGWVPGSVLISAFLGAFIGYWIGHTSRAVP